jgi:hypothetical protein
LQHLLTPQEIAMKMLFAALALGFMLVTGTVTVLQAQPADGNCTSC